MVAHCADRPARTSATQQPVLPASPWQQLKLATTSPAPGIGQGNDGTFRIRNYDIHTQPTPAPASGNEILCTSHDNTLWSGISWFGNDAGGGCCVNFNANQGPVVRCAFQLLLSLIVDYARKYRPVSFREHFFSVSSYRIGCTRPSTCSRRSAYTPRREITGSSFATGRPSGEQRMKVSLCFGCTQKPESATRWKRGLNQCTMDAGELCIWRHFRWSAVCHHGHVIWWKSR